MTLSSSELILNPDQSIYHLNLHPEDLANIVITVGDPARVAEVSSYFDHVELKKGAREFVTHTGWLKNKRLTVISTGIGTDNVDIVLNELDALANINFGTRTVKSQRQQLNLVRLGTSGSIQPDIPVDSLLMSQYALGLDSLLHCYKHPPTPYPDIEKAFCHQLNWPEYKAKPYVLGADMDLLKAFRDPGLIEGFTATNAGFYGPQGRQLRLKTDMSGYMEKLTAFNYGGLKITNLEMETSGIYALAWLLGHKAVSLNAIVVNRNTGLVSKNPKRHIDQMIRFALEKLTSS